MIDLSFSFVGKCWLWHGGKAAWHFISLPQDKSEEIKFFNENMHEKTRGWGAVRVQVNFGFPVFRIESLYFACESRRAKKRKYCGWQRSKSEVKN
jgi:hypothetical protein